MPVELPHTLRRSGVEGPDLEAQTDAGVVDAGPGPEITYDVQRRVVITDTMRLEEGDVVL
jgi:hypothetical protein